MQREKCKSCGYKPANEDFESPVSDGVCDLCRQLKVDTGTGETNDIKRAICLVGNTILEEIWNNGPFHHIS